MPSEDVFRIMSTFSSSHQIRLLLLVSEITRTPTTQSHNDIFALLTALRGILIVIFVSHCEADPTSILLMMAKNQIQDPEG